MISNQTRAHKDIKVDRDKRKLDALDTMMQAERDGGYQHNAVIYNPAYERRERARRLRQKLSKRTRP